jgi:thiamine-monophosphate kinase
VNEFDIIARYFDRPCRRDDVVVGVGDDGAVLAPPPGSDMVVVTDTVVAGRHFPEGTPAEAIGHRALAVNLSDLAAMGAEPAWMTLALTLPEADPAWLERFSRGFHALAESAGIDLVGGDTTSGPLSATVTAIGLVPAGGALRRGGASPGERIYVSGTLGDAGLDLRGLLAGEGPDGHDRFLYPTPRLELGRALRGLAGGVIDISDGLLADLGHIAEASGVGARVRLADLPLSAAVRALEPGDARTLAVSAGDDYELCFTAPPSAEARLVALEAGVNLTCIGDIVPGEGVVLMDEHGRDWHPAHAGFDHFNGGAR